MDIARAFVVVAFNQIRRYISLTNRTVRKTWISHPFVLIWAINMWFFEVALIYLYTGLCSFPKIAQFWKGQVNSVVIASPQLINASSFKQTVSIL